MKNNQNSIKNIIRKYFVKGDTDIKDFDKNINTNTPSTGYSPLKYQHTTIDVSSSTQSPAMVRAMKALQIQNPFKGV